MGMVTFIPAPDGNRDRWCFLCGCDARDERQAVQPLWPALDGKADEIICPYCFHDGPERIVAGLRGLAADADESGLTLLADHLRDRADEPWQVPDHAAYLRAGLDESADAAGWRRRLEDRIGREFTLDEYARVLDFRASEAGREWAEKKRHIRIAEWDTTHADELLDACGIEREAE